MLIKYLNLMILRCQWPITETTGRFASVLAVSIHTFTLTYTYGQEATDTGDQRS